MVDDYYNSKNYIPEQPDENFSDQELYYSTLEVLGQNETHTMYMTADEVNLVNEHYIIDFPYNCIQFYRRNYQKNNNNDDFTEGLVELVPTQNPNTVASNLNMSTTIQQIRRIYESSDYIMISQPTDLIGWYNITKDSLKELLRIIKNQYGLYDLPEDTGSYKFDRRAKKWLKTNELEDKLLAEQLQGQIYLDGSPVNIEKKLTFLERVKLWFKNLWNKISSKIKLWGESIGNWFSDAITTIKDLDIVQKNNWDIFWSNIKDKNWSSVRESFNNIIKNAFKGKSTVLSYVQEEDNITKTNSVQFESLIDLNSETINDINNINLTTLYNTTEENSSTEEDDESEEAVVYESKSNKIWVYDIFSPVDNLSNTTFDDVTDKDTNMAEHTYRKYIKSDGTKVKYQTQKSLVIVDVDKINKCTVSKVPGQYSNQSTIVNNLKKFQKVVEQDSVLATTIEFIECTCTADSKVYLAHPSLVYREATVNDLNKGYIFYERSGENEPYTYTQTNDSVDNTNVTSYYVRFLKIVGFDDAVQSNTMYVIWMVKNNGKYIVHESIDQ